VALVEFALILPVLFLLIAGILYFGRYINYQLDETHLANEAARYAAVAQVPYNCQATSTPLATCIAQQATGELKHGSRDVTAVSVCVSNGVGGAGQVGDPVTVTVKSHYNLVPILGLSATTIPDSETATMRIEQPLTSTTNILGCST
jgi:Flp pilus assembly protein TadG